MKPVVKRVLRRLALGVVLPTLVGGAVAAWLLTSQSGVRWAFTQVGILMEGGVKAAAVEGRLASPLTIRGLVYETESVRITVETLTLRWNLKGLLRRQLDVETLVADGIVVVSKPGGEKDEGLTDVHLPINILVRDAQLKRMRLGEDPKDALLVDSISLRTATIRDSLRIDRLAIRAPLFDGDFDGTVTPIGDYPVSLDMRWVYRPPGSPAYSGHGSFRGNLATLTVKETLETPFAATIDAVLTEPLRKLGLDVTARFTELRTTAIDASWPEATLGGELKVSGRPDALHLEGRLATVSEPLGKADLAFSAERAGNDWTIRRLDVTRPGETLAVTASGRVTLPDAARPLEPLLLDLEAAWRDLALPLTGKPALRSREGKAHVKGTPDAYVLEASASLSAAEIPEGRWTVNGKGDRNGLRVASFGGAILKGRLDGSGEATWSPQVTWNLVVRGHDLDPAARWPGYDGRLSFDLATRGRMTPEGPEAHVELTRGIGILRKQELTATAVVDLAGDVIRIATLDLRSGASHLAASGVVGPRSDLRFDLDAPNLSAFLPEVAGSLKANGRVTGPRDTPRIRATLEGTSLASADRRVTRLKGNVDVDLSPDGPLDVSLAAQGVTVASRTFTTVTATAKGRRSRHLLTLAGESKDGPKPISLAVELAGGLDPESTWSGTLRRLELKSKETGDWALEGTATLQASAAGGSLRDFCLASRGGRLCASGSYGDGAFELDARTERLPLDLLGAFLPPDVTITGLLEGTARLRGSRDGSLDGQVDLRPGPGEIRLRERAGQVTAVAYRDTSLRLVAGREGLHATAGALLADAGRLSLDLTLPRFNEPGLAQKAQPVTGRVLVDLNRLDVVQGFVADVRDVKGTLHADLEIGGTLGAPTVRGEAALRDGGARVPDLGITLREVTLVARGDGTGPLRFEGSLVSGGGKLLIGGETPVTPGALTATVIKLTGENVEALNQPPENRVLVSPRLTLTLRGARLDVEGELEVPEAKYERVSAFATVRVSPDVVLVGRDPDAATGGARAIHARVRLILGDKVRLKASGLDTRITGSLLVIEEPGKQTLATGELELRDGTYKAYGQDLRIERGRLFFAGGPIDNPGIDARASRKARDGTVAGLAIRGTLRAPETTLYSEPPMAQADVLAYILLGHPLNQATAQEGSLVTNAAASLGIKGGNLLMKQLAARFGLEEARIETEGTFQEASLVVGKYFSPRLYVEYGIGLFTRASTLRVSYLLNKRWTVRAETGAANAGDIFYTIEK